MSHSSPFFIHWADSIEKSENTSLLSLTIDPNKMVALKHHVFGGVCLFPFAYTTELMLQAAVHCSGLDNPYPLFFKEVEQLRGIAVPFGKTQSVKVECIRTESGEFEVRLMMDLTNKNGKVIRKDCTVATAVIELNKSLPESDFTAQPKTLNPVELPQSLYYQKIHPTHGPLFQTITGHIYLDTELEGIAGKFNLKRLDNWQSIDQGLGFWLSPLAFDSVLQLSVLNCIQIESTTKPDFHAKLPVKLENAYFPVPFNPETEYTARGYVNDIDDKDQRSRFVVSDGSGEPSALISQVTLRRAPHKHFEACDLLRDFAKYRKEEVVL